MKSILESIINRRNLHPRKVDLYEFSEKLDSHETMKRFGYASYVSDGKLYVCPKSNIRTREERYLICSVDEYGDIDMAFNGMQLLWRDQEELKDAISEIYLGIS